MPLCLPDADKLPVLSLALQGYLTPERIEKAKKLKLALTAGIGSDHVNLHAAAKHGITVAEITGGAAAPLAAAARLAYSRCRT